jgi:hypothetical protein
MSEIWFLGAAGLMSIANVVVILMRNRLDDFQTTLFRVSMLTGWVLLIATILMDPSANVDTIIEG